MKRPLIPTLLSSLLLSVTQAQEVRQWTDKATGKRIEASMVSADPKARTVTIQRKDGQSFTLPPRQRQKRLLSPLANLRPLWVLRHRPGLSLPSLRPRSSSIRRAVPFLVP